MDWFFDTFGRLGFGFANPNHAAAFICAMLPFVWGRGHGAGRLLSRGVCAVLLAALAATGSRTGLLVLAVEGLFWRIVKRRPPTGTDILWCLAAAALAGVTGLWGRFTLDGSVLNRPRIWRAGLELIGANPWGVGCGRSGLVASACLLDGLPIRSLVNAHLTLAAEFGWTVFAVWCAGVFAAAAGTFRAPRAACAFAGLVLSGLTSTVLDWGVLFGRAGQPEPDKLNLAAAWALAAVFAGCLVHLTVRSRRRTRWLAAAAGVLFAGIVCAAAVRLTDARSPRVRGEWLTVGEDGPTVFYDETWPLAAVVSRLPGGGRFRLSPGVPETFDETPEKVVLFGACAESAWRFPLSQMTWISGEGEDFFSRGFRR